MIPLRFGEKVPAKIPVSLPDNDYLIAGPAAPSAFTDLHTTIDLWIDPDHIYTADEVYAENDIMDDPPTSNKLHLKGFGFAVPAAAKIVGVSISICSFSAGEMYTFLQLYDGADFLGASKNKLTPLDDPARLDFGGTADLWGATLTPDIINSATFGLVLWTQAPEPTWTLHDWLTMTIYYIL